MKLDAERSIIFSAPMVRAILDGRKSQTRRVVKFDQPQCWESAAQDASDLAKWHFRQRSSPPTILYKRCPFGSPGDRLWVREALAIHDDRGWVYSADNKSIDGGDDAEAWMTVRPAKQRNVSPTHMPRWASRITLEVEGVRAERVRDISVADVAAEGFDTNVGYHRAEFIDLWDSTHGPGAWKRNDWVWVITFRRVAT